LATKWSFGLSADIGYFINELANVLVSLWIASDDDDDYDDDDDGNTGIESLRQTPSLLHRIRRNHQFASALYSTF